MINDILQFKIRSGGTVTIALDCCANCKTKACIKVCQIQGGPLALDEKLGVPTLRWSLAEIERGGCVECLGCELDCELYGQQAVTVALPLKDLDKYLKVLDKPVVYQG